MNYKEHERRRMQLLWAEEFGPGQLMPSGYQLPKECALLNLAPEIQTYAKSYFTKHRISWHQHANHALSSQVACLNFLMPLTYRPDVLSRVVGDILACPPPTMLPVEEGPDGEPAFVGFEWTGKDNYLNEWGSGRPTRGANVTSTDAIVRFQADDGIETLLIEWKYTERYGRATARWSEGNKTRVDRYREITFAPNGPIRSDCGFDVEDFFQEPIYQMLRQSSLAFQMQAHREDGSDRVRLLHVSPLGNVNLHRSVSARFPQGDVFEIFRDCLADPDSFLPTTTESLFQAIERACDNDDESAEWLSYLRRRYDLNCEDASDG